MSAADPSRRRGSAATSSTAADQAVVGLGQAEVEVVRPHQRAQRVVGLERRARRADADGAAAAQQARRGVERELAAEHGGRASGLAAGGRRLRRVPSFAGRLRLRRGRSLTGRLRRQQPGRDTRRPHPLRAVDELEPEPAAVAEEHLVDVAVEPAEHAAQLAVARRRVRGAAEPAVGAHRRRALQVPLARVPARERLVVEHAGRAHLDEVAAELALQRAALGAAEVHLVAQAEHAEVPPAGVVVVEPRAAVAGDAAVELVGDERPQVLVLEGPLAPAVAPVAVPGHHRHVLQVALAALVAHRAVVRVAGHHELDHLGPEADRVRVEDVHLGPLLRLGHAGHGDLALLVALAVGPVEAHGALAAGADGPEDGVPAEEGEVEAEREGDVEHVAALFGLVLGAVDDDGDELGRRGVSVAAAHAVTSPAAGASPAVASAAGASEPWRR